MLYHAISICQDTVRFAEKRLSIFLAASEPPLLINSFRADLALNGKIHYKWPFFNSKLLVYQRVPLFLMVFDAHDALGTSLDEIW